MLIGYGQPTPMTWTLTGAGTAWLGDGTPTALTDGKPARVARFRWLSSAPTIGDFVALTASWPTPAPIRVVALLGLTIPEGCKIEAAGQRVGDASATFALGGNALTQRAVRLPSGTVCCWWVLDAANPPLIGLQLKIYNDVGGATAFTPASFVDVGEIVVMPGVEIDIESDWHQQILDPTHVNRTLGAQVNSVRNRAYRRVSLNFTPSDVVQVRGAALANGMDWDQVEAALLYAQRAIAIPRWSAPGGGVDSAALHRTAIYGICTQLNGIDHLGGDYYGSSMIFEEVPA